MSTAAPRVVIVGAGLMGRWHAHSAARAGAQLVAVVDSEIERARSVAARHGDCRAHSTIREALAVGPVDVAHVCTPLSTHVALTEALIDAGLHVLVEKPVAPDEATTQALLQHASSKRRLVCPVFQWLFQRGADAARELIRAHGPAVHVEAVLCSAGAEIVSGADRDEIALEVLPHPLSLFDAFLPGGLAAVAWDVSRPAPGELRLSAADPATGASAALLVSMNARPTEASFVVRTTAATLRADMFHGYAWTDRTPTSRGGKIRRPFAVAGGQFAGAAANLVRRAGTREPAYPGLTELCSAFYSAADTGGPAPIATERALAVARTADAVADAVRRARD